VTKTKGRRIWEGNRRVSSRDILYGSREKGHVRNLWAGAGSGSLPNWASATLTKQRAFSKR